MAILKDLIVHGSSRFLNKIYASEIQTPLIDAESGIIKKLKADDVTVVGLLDVQGQMHTNSWTNSNIATIDGSFYITPTLSSSSGTVSFSSAAAATFTGTYSAVSSLYVGNNTASTVQWTSGSKILITGEVQVDGEWTPLGTLLGTLNSTNPTTSMPVVSITDNRNNSSSVLTNIYSLKGNTSLSYRNLKVSLYQRADNSEYYPLGIFMTALGQNGKTFLDIYGGVNVLTTSYGGYANPNVRIGNLSGLPAITTAAGNFTPVGWGIYTTNGYFSGTIVSNTGVIGGWKLGANSLYNETAGLNDNTVGIYLGTDGIRNYKDTNTYVNITQGVITAKGVDLTGAITATSGTIGGFQIDSSSIHTNNVAITSNADNSIALSSTDFTRTINNTSRTGLRFAIGDKFGVTGDGTIYASSVDLTGKITATSGTIGGINIIDGNLDVSSISIGSLSGVSNYAQKSYVDNAVDDIEIGGRNLLKNSNVVLNDITNYIVGGVVTQTLPTGTIITLSVQIDADDVSWKSSGSKLRIGVASSIVKDSGGNQYLEVWAAQTGRSGTGIVKTFDTSFHGRIKCTYTLQGTLEIGKNFSLYIQDVASGTVSISNPKLEIGNKATDWTPAPEDTQENINSVSTTASTALNQSVEYIKGTQTAATASWTGVTTESSLRDGKIIMYYLPYKGAANVTLNLTLADNTTTGAIPVYLNYSTSSNDSALTRVSTHYPAGSVIQMTYDGVANQWKTTGYNTNVNTNTVGILGANKLLAGKNSSGASGTTIYKYTLIMKNVEGDNARWVSLVTSSSTGTSKTRYTGGLYPDEVYYTSANANYATDAQTGTLYRATSIDLRYSTNCGSTLVLNKPVYLVGEINSLDGLFYLDPTWWTQTEPTMEDGKTYIYIGRPYSAYQVYLSEKKPIMRFYQGAFRTEEQIAGMTATSYITYVNTTDGIKIHNASDTNNYLQLNSSAINFYRNNVETLKIEDSAIRVGKIGENEQNVYIADGAVQIRDNEDILASFGADGVQIGVDSNSKFRLFDKGIYGYNNNGANFFALDMYGSNSAVTVQEKYNSNRYWYNSQRQSNGDCIITIPDNCKNDYLNKLYIKYGRRYRSAGGEIYENTYSTYFTFILGTAKEDDYYIGAVYDHRTHELISYNYRVSFSYDGNNTLTLSIDANVFEDDIIYYFFYLDYLLYQTITTAPAFTFGTRDTAYTLGDFSTTFGLNNAASGIESIAIGNGSIAASNYQTAIGKFNISDSSDTYSFIIGNGTSDSARSNVFTVDWSGNVIFSGGATIGGNTSITGTLDVTGAITQNSTAVSLDGHTHAAGDITSGTLPIDKGGTGDTGTSATTTASSIVTAGNGFTIESASYAQWGKLAMIYIVFKKNATAITQATNISLGTMVTGKRPKYRAPAMSSWTQNALIYTDGVIHMYGTVAANASVGIYSTFILA